MKYFIDDIYQDDFSEVASLIMTHDVLYDHVKMMVSDFLKAGSVEISHRKGELKGSVPFPIFLQLYSSDIVYKLLAASTGTPVVIDDVSYTLTLPDCYGDC